VSTLLFCRNLIDFKYCVIYSNLCCSRTRNKSDTHILNYCNQRVVDFSLCRLSFYCLVQEQVKLEDLVPLFFIRNWAWVNVHLPFKPPIKKKPISSPNRIRVRIISFLQLKFSNTTPAMSVYKNSIINVFIAFWWTLFSNSAPCDVYVRRFYCWPEGGYLSNIIIGQLILSLLYNILKKLRN